MAGKKSDLGPIGKNVARMVRHFRELRRLSYAELSRQLTEIGREIPPLGLRRIESEDRKVDVDDLCALALVLGVSPLAILIPVEDSPLAPQGIRYDANKIWKWATGSQALTDENAFRFIRDSNPLIDWTDVEPRLAQEATVMLNQNQETARGNDQ